MEMIVSLTLVAVGVLMLMLLIKLLKTPIKWAFKLLLNGALGFVGLFMVNYFGEYIGISLGMNWVNAIVAGVLGMPGIVLLLFLKYLV